MGGTICSSGIQGTPETPSKGSTQPIHLFACSQGLVLGIYTKEKENDVPQFTSAGENFDKLVSGKLREILNMYVFASGSQFFKCLKNERIFFSQLYS